MGSDQGFLFISSVVYKYFSFYNIPFISTWTYRW